MAAELFKIMTGSDVVFVRYRADAQVITDLLGGQVQVAFGGISPVLPHIRAGKLSALGVTATTRSAELPDVPRIADTVSGFEATGWCGIVAPRNTPLAIVQKPSGSTSSARTRRGAVSPVWSWPGGKKSAADTWPRSCDTNLCARPLEFMHEGF